MPISSGSSEEIIRTATPSLRELADQVVDAGLGADVDAARRLVEDQDLRLRLQPLGEHDLLLVAAREEAHLLLGAARAQLGDRRRAREIVIRPSAERRLRAGITVRTASIMLSVIDCAEREALGLAVLGDEAEAGPDRVTRRAEAHRLAVDLDRAGADRVGAEDRARDLGPARALQAGEADDLARADLEVDVAQQRRLEALDARGARRRRPRPSPRGGK